MAFCQAVAACSGQPDGGEAGLTVDEVERFLPRAIPGIRPGQRVGGAVARSTVILTCIIYAFVEAFAHGLLPVHFWKLIHMTLSPMRI